MRKKLLLLALSLAALAGALATRAEAYPPGTICCFCDCTGPGPNCFPCECGPCAEPGV